MLSMFVWGCDVVCAEYEALADNDVKFDCLVNNYWLADLRRCEQKDVPERRDGDYFEIQVLLPFFLAQVKKDFV